MSVRLDRLHALAWSLDDLLPLPATSTGAIVRRSAGSGEGPSHRVACRSCEGEGSTLDRFKRPAVCVVCSGKGWEDIDDYTQRRVGVSFAAQATEAGRSEQVGCAWCQMSSPDDWRAGRFRSMPRGSGVRAGVRCEACGGSGWKTLTVPVEVDELRGDPRLVVERALERRARAGSYCELDQALRMLRRASRSTCRTWVGVRVAGGEANGSGGVLELGDRWLLERLPARIRVPADVLAAWELSRLASSRDERIRVLARRGAGPDAIARVVGNVSGRTVRRVLYERRR